MLFQRYWQRVGDEVDEPTASMLERLVAMEDHDLWELVCGRRETDDPQLKGMIEQLRQA